MCSLGGLNLDDWQAWYLTESLRESSVRTRSGGLLWSAAECANIVPRQNGKGSIFEARQVTGLFLLGEMLQVHTAHEFKTCYEHFLRVVNLIESYDEFDRRVMRVRRGAGEQAIELKSGERLRFLARSAGSGRGMSAPVVYLDEAFALTRTIMGALLPTMSAQENPQLFYASSQAKATSDVLHDLRRRAKTGASPRLLLAEWACDADCDPADRENWYQANPGLGIRITEQSVAMELEALSPEEFARERLGVPEGEDGAPGVVPVELWDSLIDDGYEMVGPARLAVDVSADLKWSSIVAVQDDTHGLSHVEVVDRRQGTEWVVARVVDLCQRTQSSVAVATNGPAVAQVPLLEAAGVVVTQVGPTDVMRAAAGFVDACQDHRLRHRGSPSLRAAITAATVKTVGDLTQWVRATSTGDISALVACSIALAGQVSLPYFAL